MDTNQESTARAESETAAAAPVLVSFATQSGGTTLDRDAQGGNPFASALIELADERDLTLGALMPRLRDLTELKGSGYQIPAKHGFSVRQGVGPRRVDLRRALTSFRRRSLEADVSIIYSTGHGIESNGAVYLVPSDYPFATGYRPNSLRHHAVSVAQMVTAARSRTVNAVFFAGCRTSA